MNPIVARLITAFVVSGIMCGAALAQDRVPPRPRQRPQIPPAPLVNPQAAPVYYPAPAVNNPGAPVQTYYPAPAGAPPQIATSNRCWVGGSFGLLNQWVPIGTGCWVSDVNGNVFNGVVQ
jgi:hypothetical protein